MSILTRILGGGGRSPEELRLEAEARMEEARGFALTAPREGINALRHFASGGLEQIVDFGQPLHARFAQTVGLVLDAAARAASPTILPVCAVYTDPPVETRDEIEALAAESEDGALFVRFPSRWDGHRMTLAALEALWMLARDPWIAAIYLGEDYAVYRNPVFVDAVEHLKHDLEIGANVAGLNDVLSRELGLEEAPDLVTPCGFEAFAYRFRFPNGE
jgi:hypothetical protein